MPTLTIDGQEVTVEPGTTVLQAAKQVGVDIPTFCYHPGLTVVANCRMCLVDVQDRRGQLKPACHVHAQDGMQVDTQSERVKRTQTSVLEFILLNHPVDCPICDQAGECVLQDHYFAYSAKPSRLAHRKQHKAKAKVLGPDIILDAERCILCTRCIRFCDEVAKDSQLTIVNRGEHAEISTFPDKQLDNPYSVNTVDICPVGALTSRDFRFRTRVWMLSSEESVCPECSRGCKTRIDTFENTPRRYKPMHNPQVNDWWMCDSGRASFAAYLEGRMEGPTVVAESGKRIATGGANALADAAKAVTDAGAMGRVAVVVTPWMTNEDAFLLGKLLAGAWAGANVFLGGRADGDADDILIRADKNPNRVGVTAVFDALGVEPKPLEGFAGGFETVVVVGDQHAFTDAQMAQLEVAPRRVVMGTHMGPLWKLATTFLPLRLHWEKDGTFTNGDGIVQRIRRATRAAGTCKSEGYYAMKLAQAFGMQLVFKTPAAIFSAMAEDVPAFAGMSHANLGPFGQRLGAGPVPVSPADGSDEATGQAEAAV